MSDVVPAEVTVVKLIAIRVNCVGCALMHTVTCNCGVYNPCSRQAEDSAADGGRVQLDALGGVVCDALHGALPCHRAYQRANGAGGRAAVHGQWHFPALPRVLCPGVHQLLLLPQHTLPAPQSGGGSSGCVV